MTSEAQSPLRIDTVMLIDDERIDRMMYRRVIDRSGLVGQLVTFSYADEALEYLRSRDRPRIDVIFLDINMPRMTGFEFLEAATREFGAAFADLVVVMLTTSLDPRDVARARTIASVRDFVNKPLTQQHLVRAAELLRDMRAGQARPAS